MRFRTLGQIRKIEKLYDGREKETKEERIESFSNGGKLNQE